MWKISTAQISKPRTVSRTERMAQGNKKNMRFIDQKILKESKARRKMSPGHGLTTNKAYDISMGNILFFNYKISNKVITFIVEAMKNSKVEMTAGGKTLVEVKISRGNPLGDALSP